MKIRNPWRHPFHVPAIGPPRSEGRFRLSGGRHLGYAEYGSAFGSVVLWFHGTPGGRRQVPLRARRMAEDLGLRIVAVERPGAGVSDPYAYGEIIDWATDMVAVADALGAERLGVVGMSGGGPYALACGALPELANRVAAISVLGSPTPSAGPDATATGIIDFAHRVEPLVSTLRRPLAALTSAVLIPSIPFGHYTYHAFSAFMPEAGQQVFAHPDIEAMFIDDMVHNAQGGFQAVFEDARLFGRDWGFRLSDVTTPVRWAHGDIEPFVSLDNVKAAVKQMPNTDLVVLHNETHLAGFATADDILYFVHEHL